MSDGTVSKETFEQFVRTAEAEIDRANIRTALVGIFAFIAGIVLTLIFAG